MKLLRKDVLKWIRALKSGSYKKGKERLVSGTGTKFCCLGVWADMHGATWSKENATLVPVAKGHVKVSKSQAGSSSYLNDLKLAKGLDLNQQRDLAHVNDNNGSFGPVIKYIEENILPLAK